MAAPPARFDGEVLNVAVEGGDLAVETLGDGPAVLLIHGWTLDRRIWTPQVQALAQRYRVIAYDRRGFGQSAVPPDITREPDDVAAVARLCGADRFALVGMSQGGRIALAYAQREPHRLSALVLHGAAVSDVPFDLGDDEEVPVAEMRELARSGQLDRLRRLWTRHALMTLYSARHRPLLDAIVADYDARDLLGPVQTLQVSAAALEAVSAHVLIVTGSRESAWRRKVAATLAAHARGSAEWVSLPSSGHLANLCRPVRYNRLLIDFLERTHAGVDGQPA